MQQIRNNWQILHIFERKGKHNKTDRVFSVGFAVCD